MIKEICGIKVSITKYNKIAEVRFEYVGKKYFKKYKSENLENKIKKFILKCEKNIGKSFEEIRLRREKQLKEWTEEQENYEKIIKKRERIEAIKKEKFYKKYGTYEKYLQVHKECVEGTNYYPIYFWVKENIFKFGEFEDHNEYCSEDDYNYNKINYIIFCPYCGKKLEKPELLEKINKKLKKNE